MMLYRTALASILFLYTLKWTETVVVRVSFNSTTDDLPYYCQYCSCEVTSGGMITDCSGKGLFKPPRNIDNRTIELYLGENFIKVVRNTSLDGLNNLKILDLSENTISVIEVGTFKDLTSLTHLYLNGQITRDLFILQRVFPPGVFQGLEALKVLHVHNCLKMAEADSSRIPASALKELPALEELSIDGIPNATFDEDFKQLKNLTKVVMSGYNGFCMIHNLDRKSLVGLFKVQNLTINKCGITSIKPGTFWWTPELSYLDVSWNTELEIYNFGKLFDELRYTRLNILKINAIHNPDRAGTEILRPDVKYLRDISLTDMYMDDNGIEYVDYGVFDMFPKTLKRLYLRRNKLNFGFYLYEAIFNNPNLEVFNAGDQELVAKTDLSIDSIFGGIRSRRRREVHAAYFVHIMREKRSESNPKLNLKTLICSGSTLGLKPVDFSSTINNITYMDLSRNLIPKLQSKAFEGLYAVQYLNLSNNYIENAIGDAFYGLDSVDVLDLQNNLLGYELKEDETGNLFSPLASLRILNLSRNRIIELDKGVLKYIRNLESIDLSNNYIENLDIDVLPLSRLKFIDLRFNRLQSIPESVRKHLDTLSEKHQVRVDLGSNKLSCSCNNIPFLKWLFHSKVEFPSIDSYYCSLKNDEIKVFNESRTAILDKLEEDCKSYLGVIVGGSTGASIISAFLVSYLIYYNRWKLRYAFYMARIKLDQHNVEVNNREEEHFPYDVFISYGDGDRPFVINEMLQKLETAGGKRLNIRDRDFEIGEVIAVNISKAIRTSKKTFLLLSRHFLRNKWCNFEMNMARMEAMHMKRDVIVIIFLETIPAKCLPIEVLDLLRECPNIDFPKQMATQVAFWQKCVDYINTD